MTERPKPRLVASTPDAAASPPGNGARAVWTLLMFTLVGPFVAALIVLALTLGAGLAGAGPQSLRGLAMPALAAKSAEWAVTSYVWSALPAALAGLALALTVVLRGGFPWLAAVTASGVAASAFAALSPGVARDHTAFIAFFAAISGLVVWGVLRRARIIL